MEKNSKAEMNQLPPGFRFHPSDEELIVHYLRKKATKTPLPASIVADVELYKLNPWDLPKKSLFGDEEWYFFTPRDRKYPNGLRPNRMAASGYWKATGIDKPILTSCGSKVIGVKKALVFYIGRSPKGNKTDWIMQEYRLPESSDHLPSWSNKKHNSMRLDEWVLCRVRQKTGSGMPFGNIQENRKLDHKDNYVYQELADCPPLIPFLFGNNNNSNSDHQDFPCSTETAVSCISFEFVDSNIINKATSSSVCEVENNCNLRKRKLQEQGGLIINGREDCNNNDEKKKVMNNGDCYQQLITVDRSSENDYCGEDDHVSGMMMMMISSDQELELELAQNNYVDQSMMYQDLFNIHSFT